MKAIEGRKMADSILRPFVKDEVKLKTEPVRREGHFAEFTGNIHVGEADEKFIEHYHRHGPADGPAVPGYLTDLRIGYLSPEI